MGRRPAPPKAAPTPLPVADLVDAFQREVVLPHCPRCARPCCALTDVVLDLSFAQASALYRIGSSKPSADAALPASLRRQGGRYYAHGAPCPAFDQASHRCGVYGTATKPQGCSDFPVYEDGDVVTVDLRCEAAAGALATLRDRLGAVGLVDEQADADFPDVFVTFARPRAARGGRR